MKMVTMLGALVGATLVATPVMAVTLSAKERARVARAAPRDRDDVRYCLIQGKKGRDKGTVIGAAGGAWPIYMAVLRLKGVQNRGHTGA